MLVAAFRPGIDAVRGEIKSIIEPLKDRVDEFLVTVISEAENGPLAAEDPAPKNHED